VLITIVLFAILFSKNIFAQNLEIDTVWVKKVNNGSWARFSPTGKYYYIYQPNGEILFYNFESDELIGKLTLGSGEIFFLENDDSFFRSFKIFDTKTLQVIDSVETGNIRYAALNTSRNKKYLLATFVKDTTWDYFKGLWGFRIWDLQSKTILKTVMTQEYQDGGGGTAWKSLGPIFMFNDSIIYIHYSYSASYGYGYFPKSEREFGKFTYNLISNQLNKVWFISRRASTIECYSFKYTYSNTGSKLALCYSLSCGYQETTHNWYYEDIYGFEVYSSKQTFSWENLSRKRPYPNFFIFTYDENYLVINDPLEVINLNTFELISPKDTLKPWGFDISPDDKYLLAYYDSTLVLYKLNLPKVIVVEEKDSLVNDNIFPNPATNYSTVKISSPKPQIVTLSVTNLLGMKLMSQTFSLGEGENQISINLSDFPNGIYLVNVFAGNQNQILKLIVNK
jgi:hypothetical protein